VVPLRERHSENPLIEAGTHFVPVDVFGKAEPPLKNSRRPFKSMVNLLRDLAGQAALTLQKEHLILNLKVNLFSLDAWNFCRNHEFVGRLKYVYRRRPVSWQPSSGWLGANNCVFHQCVKTVVQFLKLFDELLPVGHRTSVTKTFDPGCLHKTPFDSRPLSSKVSFLVVHINILGIDHFTLSRL
jgi:hypothetical protein